MSTSAFEVKKPVGGLAAAPNPALHSGSGSWIARVFSKGPKQHSGPKGEDVVMSTGNTPIFQGAGPARQSTSPPKARSSKNSLTGSGPSSVASSGISTWAGSLDLRMSFGETCLEKLPEVPKIPIDIPLPNDIAAVIRCTVRSLEGMITSSRRLRPEDPSFAEFANDPTVPLYDWILGIANRCNLSMACYPCSAFYLNRLLQKHPNLHVTCNNVYRLFYVGLMAAAKFLEDKNYRQKDWSALAGCFTTATLKKMEVEFLRLLSFETFIPSDELLGFLQTKGGLEAASATSS